MSTSLLAPGLRHWWVNVYADHQRRPISQCIRHVCAEHAACGRENHVRFGGSRPLYAVHVRLRRSVA